MNDLKIETFRASGPGGQHVNKTDSAVRITHLPSGLVTESQKERSQHVNKETCIELLASKLERIEEKKRRQAKADAYQELDTITWGNQIRNYVFAPYQSIKDSRTGVE